MEADKRSLPRYFEMKRNIPTGSSAMPAIIRASAETISVGPFAITVNKVIGRVSYPGGYTKIVVPNSPIQNRKEINHVAASP